MAEGGRTKKEGGKRPRGRGRPVRRPASGGGGAIQVIVGLGLAVAVFATIFAIMKSSGMDDKTYMNEYIRTVRKLIHDPNEMDADLLWNRIHALPRDKVKDPKLKELDDALVEYASVIRDTDAYGERGPGLEERIERLEMEAAQQLGVQVQVR